MRILSCRYENFRNIESADLTFSSGINLLHGENAQGKTNAIEGMYLFARGKSFRAAAEKDLVRFGCDGFRLCMTYEDKNGQNTVTYAVFGNERKRTLNGVVLGKPAEMIGKFRAVLFTPDHLTLIKGSPEERRNFLNVAISQCDPTYIRYFSLYKKVTEERNALLKFAQKGMNVDRDELVSWNKSAAEYASYLYCYRKDYVDKMMPFFLEAHGKISDGKEKTQITYKADIENVSNREEAFDAYVRLFTENVSREIGAGTTLFGPGRDDFSVLTDGKEARFFASQGQQRSLVLSLKNAEGEVCKSLFGEYPVFLFDDVLSELDEKRKSFILSGSGEKQIILTSCENKWMPEIGNVIEVGGGQYVSSRG